MVRENEPLTILSWNCRSIYNKLSELKRFVNKMKPHVVCLQETWIQDPYLPSFQNYNPIYKNRLGTRGGGLAFLIRKDILTLPNSFNIEINAKLEAQLVKIECSGRNVDILNIYNPNKVISKEEWDFVLSQLGESGVVIGDFNCHHPSWTSRRPACATGRSLVESSNSNFLKLITQRDTVTFLNSSRNYAPSTLDLVFTTNDLCNRFKFEVPEDLGSDHLAITISVDIRPVNYLRKTRKVWKVEDGDWVGFRSNLKAISSPDDILASMPSVEGIASQIQTEIGIAVEKKFSLTKGIISYKFSAPWWNDSCEEVVNSRKQARTALRRSPCPLNVLTYRRASARARQVINEAKSESKKRFISSITSQTTTKLAWSKINSFRKSASAKASPIIHGGVMITSDIGKAEVFADHFRQNSDLSSGSHDSTPESSINNPPWNLENERSDAPISLLELEGTIANLKDGAPGLDNISNAFIKKLPEEYLHKILLLYNEIFRSGIIPKAWKQALIIPIPKKDKDKSSVSAYRPISLLPCLGKVLEKVIKERLCWIVEKRSLLSRDQSGFRSRLSIMDQVARIETRIRVGLATGKTTIAVFLDLKSAYDMVPHQNLINLLESRGIKGNLLQYLRDFLIDRKARVCCGASISQPFEQKVGLPQGSSLSPLLFNLYISDIPKSDGALIAEYADDLALVVNDESEMAAVAKAQYQISMLENYFCQKSLLISIEKTKAMIFSTRKNISNHTLKLNGGEVEFVPQFKYLGITLDGPLLTWRPYISELTIAGNQRANILKALSAKTWGADRRMLLTIYKSLVLSKLNYGAEFISTASKTNLLPLDKIQNNCLRLIIGAELSSPIISLEVEAGVAPLEVQREKLQLNYFSRLRQLPDTLSVVQLLPEADVLSSLRWSAVFREPLALRCRKIWEKIGLPLPTCYPYPLYKPYSPWSEAPKIRWSLKSHSIELLDQAAHLLFRELVDENYMEEVQVYTDGSREVTINGNKVSAAIVVPVRGFTDSWKLPPNFSIFSAELYGINRALSYIEGHQENRAKYLICSDSLSALSAIKFQGESKKNSLLWEVTCKLNNLTRRGAEITMEWVPGHKGIQGNELADKAARKALYLPYITVPGSTNQDMKSEINKIMENQWKKRWDREFTLKRVGGAIREIKSTVSYWPWCSLPDNRKMETCLARLRIGHSGLRANRSRFGNEISPFCECGEPESVRHVLLDCQKYLSHRNILRGDIQNLDIEFNIKNLLGGADVALASQLLIRQSLSKFLDDTDLSSRI